MDHGARHGTNPLRPVGNSSKNKSKVQHVQREAYRMLLHDSATASTVESAVLPATGAFIPAILATRGPRVTWPWGRAGVARGGQDVSRLCSSYEAVQVACCVDHDKCKTSTAVNGESHLEIDRRLKEK